MGVIHRQILAFVSRRVRCRRPDLVEDLHVLARIDRKIRRNVGDELDVAEIEWHQTGFSLGHRFCRDERNNVGDRQSALRRFRDRDLLLRLKGGLFQYVGQQELELVFSRRKRQPAFISERPGLNSRDIRLGKIV
jgi:hypothetical protein